MSESTHTPGPWRNVGGEIVAADLQRVLFESRHWGRPTKQYYADCALVEAAPDLLEACKLIADTPSTPFHAKAISLARAAIAKAKGGAQ